MNQVDEFLGRGLALRPCQSLFFETVEHVLADGLPGEQGEVLEHDAAVRPGAGDVAPVDGNISLLQLHEAAKQVEQGGFAATGRPENRQKFAIPDLQVDIVERQHRPATGRPVFMAY